MVDIINGHIFCCGTDFGEVKEKVYFCSKCGNLFWMQRNHKPQTKITQFLKKDDSYSES